MTDLDIHTLRPVTDDPDTGGFFATAGGGNLAVLRCVACESVLHLPRAHCHRCGAWETTWTPVSGRGHLYSWTVVRHQVHPAYPVPHTIVLVALADHPEVRLVGHLPGAPELTPGQEMVVRFDQLDHRNALPQWQPV